MGTYNTKGVLLEKPAVSAGKAGDANANVKATEPQISTIDALQMLLDVIGLIPGFGAPADLINGIISAARGDFFGAALSLIGVVPVAGEAAVAAKIAKNSEKYLEALDVVVRKVVPHQPASVGRKIEDAVGAARAKIDELAGKPTTSGGLKKPESEAPTPQSQGRDGGKAKGKTGGPCDHLRQGSGSGPYRGGAHSKTSSPRNDSKDSHHMPADDISPLARRDGPAIQIDPADHKITSSNGSSKEAVMYRQLLEKLLSNGRWRQAMAIEIKDIRAIASEVGDPRKYNEAMLEMLEYFKCLESNGLLE